jgi:ROS/MUCR transcriptional regulator protein
MPPRFTAADGTPLHAPPGRLVADPDDDVLLCHLCGRWFTSLGRHVGAHCLSADEYRELTGLEPRRALVARWLSRRRAEVLRERIATDPRIQGGMATGRGLARSGALQTRAQEVARQRGPRAARETTLREHGSALGRRRADAFRREREARARALGHASLDAYLRRRYVRDGAGLEDLQRELGAGYSAVRGDLRRAGIEPRRGAPRRS